MNIVVHQPHFLPWIGYFNKLSYADVFVFQDNVQFRRRYYQNRTKIRHRNSSCFWLTVPVSAKRNTFINEVITSDSFSKNKLFKTIEHCYSKSIYFDEVWPQIKSSISSAKNTLMDINERTLLCIFELLDIKVSVHYASEYPLLDDPASTIVSICTSIGADNYIFGEGHGLDYHGYSKFHKEGIKTCQQDFLSEYKLNASNYFSDCIDLSVIDFLFSIGISKTKKYIHKFGKLKVIGN